MKLSLGDYDLWLERIEPTDDGVMVIAYAVIQGKVEFPADTEIVIRFARHTFTVPLGEYKLVENGKITVNIPFALEPLE